MKDYTQTKLSRIKSAADTLNREDTGYGTNPTSAPFLFSTENLIDTYQAIPVKDKTLLTVAASGDHIFDAYLNGAKYVSSFDFNQMQECVMRAKTDLIHQMKYSEFMSFFFDTLMSGRIQESYKILKPFMPKMSLEGQAMLDEFYSSNNQAHFFHPHPFYAPGTYMYKRDKIGYIQSESNYRELQKRLPDRIDFTLAHSEEIAKQCDKKYDIIHLSNIMTTYIHQQDNSFDGCLSFFAKTLQPMLQKLTPNGKLIVCYLWMSNFCNRIHYPYNSTLSNAIRSQPNTLFCQREFESVREDSPWHSINDAILFAQKTK